MNYLIKTLKSKVYLNKRCKFLINNVTRSNILLKNHQFNMKENKPNGKESSISL